jgi:3-methyladenine DNA glycosylase AlkD
MPEIREIVRKYWREIPLKELEILVNSKIHEERSIGLLILVEKFKKSDEKHQKLIYNFYLSHIKSVNNWDLVDLTAHKVIGKYLLDKKKQRKVLYQLAKSKNLWKRRISIKRGKEIF